MAEPIRVLHMLPDLKVGGGQHLLLRHLVGMDRAAVQNHLCYVRPPREMEPHFTRAGFPPEGLNMGGGPGFPAALRRLLRLIGERRIQLIHTNNTAADRLLGQTAALLRSLPVVNSLHSEFEPLPSLRGVSARVKSLPRAFSRGTSLWLARRTVRHVVPVSRGVQASWTPYLRQQGIADGSITVVYPGLEESRFAPRAPERIAELRRALDIEDSSPVLLNVGRLNHGKGQRHLIPLMREVVNVHPRAVLLIAGDGPDHTVLDALVKQLSLEGRVRLLGRREDVADLVWLADLFVFPSYSEGFPLAVLEAMAAGAAVVAFSIPAFDELMTPGQEAELVPLPDEQALTRAVMGLLGDQPRRHAMGCAARATVSRYSQRASSEALVRIYSSLVAPT